MAPQEGGPESSGSSSPDVDAAKNKFAAAAAAWAITGEGPPLVEAIDNLRRAQEEAAEKGRTEE
jgi:hypothetical protein